MLKTLTVFGLASTLSLFVAGAALAEPAVGKAAPDFTGVTATGETVSLSDLKGKTVVLEWTNHQCPFVSKHYDASKKNMQTTQKSANTDEDLVWLQVISSAPGRQGYVEGEEAIALNDRRGADVDGTVLDPEGTIGRSYAARTTPHMYIIDEAGTLRYMGGIDSIPSARVSDIDKATNYVKESLAAMNAGDAVPNPVTRAYGCTVKYSYGS